MRGGAIGYLLKYGLRCFFVSRATLWNNVRFVHVWTVLRLSRCRGSRSLGG